jgi:hypothetical protein
MCPGFWSRVSISESGLKTKGFGLKPTNSLVFNNPDRQLVDGATYVVVNKGISPIN